MDIFNKCFDFNEAKQVMQAGYYPYFIPMSGNDGTIVDYQDHRCIMCGSNNYLGLTKHPEVLRAALQAVERFGTSCTGSRFLNGTLELHEQLENELAQWVNKPAALVFTTGMQTNLGVISSLVGRKDIVIIDKASHASIIDGARLSWGKIVRFLHNDLGHLSEVLEELPADCGKLVIVDGVYSMEGDLAPLPGIVELCRKHGARLLVDDAHAIGVIGEGKGSAAHFGLSNQVDLIMGTFSKAMASLGGFIAGDQDVIHFIKHHARSFIFSASISPSNAAAALAALHVMRKEPERIRRVNEIGEFMRREFTVLGLDISNSSTPIVPIHIGGMNRTFIAWKKLFDRGVFVNASVTPAVPEGQELLRTSFMATHTDEQLLQVLSAFESVFKETGLI